MPEGHESILDKVLESQKILHSSYPQELILSMIQKELDQREQDVVKERYGLGKQVSTLDAIGKRLGITRERVRQIAKQAIQKLIIAKKEFSKVRSLDITLKELLEKSGGIREQQALLNEIHKDATQHAYVLFFLNHLSDIIQPGSFSRPSWQLVGAPVDLHKNIEAIVIDYLSQHNLPQTADAIHTVQQTNEAYQEWQELFTKAWLRDRETTVNWPFILTSYLELSEHLSVNPFGEWGPSDSVLVAPRRMADKIYLVLNKYQKPLHFHKITEQINQLNFDKKKAYSPTVHNELILDSRFVLVGRGIYAMKEWGYRHGTVAEVLQRILGEAPEPLNREQLVQAVLKERVVKTGTILLALSDKSKFEKLPDGRYCIAVPESLVLREDNQE